MRRAPDGLTPPLFKYEKVISTSNQFVLIYDNHRNLCPLLWGAIKGAADLYHEKAHIVEQTCMRQGAPTCRFKVAFSPSEEKPLIDAQLAEYNAVKRQFADLVLSIVPASKGITLVELQGVMKMYYQGSSPRQLRPSTLLEALHHLQHAGLVASTVNQPGDTLMTRRYWRVPTTG
jgi:hypothetical protein